MSGPRCRESRVIHAESGTKTDRARLPWCLDVPDSAYARPTGGGKPYPDLRRTGWGRWRRACVPVSATYLILRIQRGGGPAGERVPDSARRPRAWLSDSVPTSASAGRRKSAVSLRRIRIRAIPAKASAHCMGLSFDSTVAESVPISAHQSGRGPSGLRRRSWPRARARTQFCVTYTSWFRPKTVPVSADLPHDRLAAPFCGRTVLESAWITRLPTLAVDNIASATPIPYPILRKPGAARRGRVRSRRA